MSNKILKKIKSKKGGSTVEFVINITIYLLLFAFGVEMIFISYKYMMVSHYSNEVARTLAVQGGVCINAPTGYQGGNSEYKNIDKLLKEKDELAKMIWAASDDLNVTINVNKGGGNKEARTLNERRDIKINYLETFEVVVQYKPKFMVIGNFVNIVEDSVMKKTRTGMSEYLYDYGVY